MCRVQVHIQSLWFGLGNKIPLVNDKARLCFQLNVLLVTANIFCNKSDFSQPRAVSAKRVHKKMKCRQFCLFCKFKF